MQKYYIGVDYNAFAEFSVLADSTAAALELGQKYIRCINGVELHPLQMKIEINSIETFAEKSKDFGENFDGVFPCVNEEPVAVLMG